MDRARKLVALDRALMEIGELGVLERCPEELASLEARLFGSPVAGAPDAAGGGTGDDAATGEGEGVSAEGEPVPGDPEHVNGAAAATGAPALSLMQGAGRPASPADRAQRRALRAQFRIIEGGRKVV